MGLIGNLLPALTIVVSSFFNIIQLVLLPYPFSPPPTTIFPISDYFPYYFRGRYLMSEVPRTLPTLRKIEVQGHIFSDHRSASMFEALLEVLYVYMI